MIPFLFFYISQWWIAKRGGTLKKIMLSLNGTRERIEIYMLRVTELDEGNQISFLFIRVAPIWKSSVYHHLFRSPSYTAFLVSLYSLDINRRLKYWFSFQVT